MTDMPEEFQISLFFSQQLKAINCNANLACNLITETGANTVDYVVSRMEWICQTYVLASGASQSAWNWQKYGKSAQFMHFDTHNST